ncbi:MAG: alpha/beta fold hydrolase [Legionella sp.]|nr:alpha/beta fold hydrolase [Legionella sp.]
MNNYTLLFLLSMALCTPIMAKSSSTNVVLPNTQVQQIQSETNGVSYKLFISLPKGYRSSGKNYPIIYLLDADYSFALAKQISEHLSERNRIEKSILVGIAYDNDLGYKTNRTRDYTPSYISGGGYGPQYQKYSGGAEKFFRFISAELIPFLQKHYRISQDATFIGHSYGGLFGVYLLLNHPEIINNYVIVSPSLWYDQYLLLNRAQNKTDFNLNKRTNVSFIIGANENNGDYKMVNDLKRLHALIINKPHHNLHTSISIINDMDHDTIFPMAFTQGIMKKFIVN